MPLMGGDVYIGRFKQRHVGAMPSEQRIHASLSAPVYVVCAVYLTAKKHKVCAGRSCLACQC